MRIFILVFISIIVSGTCSYISLAQEDWDFVKHQSYWTERRDPWFATLLSLVVPGVGQFYNGDRVKGVMIFASIAGWYGLATYEDKGEHPYDTFAGICLLGHWLFSPIDAYFSSLDKNAELRLKYGIIDVGYKNKISATISYRF